MRTRAYDTVISVRNYAEMNDLGVNNNPQIIQADHDLFKALGHRYFHVDQIPDLVLPHFEPLTDHTEFEAYDCSDVVADHVDPEYSYSKYAALPPLRALLETIESFPKDRLSFDFEELQKYFDSYIESVKHEVQIPENPRILVIKDHPLKRMCECDAILLCQLKNVLKKSVTPMKTFYILSKK